MKRWRLLAAVAGTLAACITVDAQASAEFCLYDPELVIQLPSKDSVTVFVTEGARGPEHLPTLQLARISYIAEKAEPKGKAQVTVYDYIPDGSVGRFATFLVVSSEPYGAGTVYGSTTGTSGTTMAVTFLITTRQT